MSTLFRNIGGEKLQKKIGKKKGKESKKKKGEENEKEKEDEEEEEDEEEKEKKRKVSKLFGNCKTRKVAKS